MSQYPEHDKLSEVKTQTQAIGEFLDWASDSGVQLCRLEDNDHFYPVGSFMPLLAEWAGIDMDKIEAEKRQMLDELRKANGYGE